MPQWSLYNQLIRNTTSSVDILMDFAKVMPDPNNTAYFNTDRLHPTDTGYSLMAFSANAAVSYPAPLWQDVGLQSLNSFLTPIHLQIEGASTTHSTIGTVGEFDIIRPNVAGETWPEMATWLIGSWGGGVAPTTRLDLALKSTSNSTLVANNTVMTWQDNGYVGIGTTAPTANLQVVGSSTTSGAATFGGKVKVTSNDLEDAAGTKYSTSTATSGGSVSTSSPITTNNYPYWATAGGGLSGTSPLNYSSNGSLGVNTSTPQNAFSVQASSNQPIAFSVNASTGQQVATFDTSPLASGDFILNLKATSTAPVFTVDTNGNTSSSLAHFTTLTVGSCTGCGAGSTSNSSSSLIDSSNALVNALNTTATTTVMTLPPIASSSLPFGLQIAAITGRANFDFIATHAAPSVTNISLLLNNITIASTSYQNGSGDAAASGYVDFVVTNGTSTNTFNGTMSTTYNPGTFIRASYSNFLNFSSSTYSQSTIGFTPTSTLSLKLVVKNTAAETDTGNRLRSYYAQYATQ
jgi:hypothetical protein